MQLYIFFLLSAWLNCDGGYFSLFRYENENMSRNMLPVAKKNLIIFFCRCNWDEPSEIHMFLLWKAWKPIWMFLIFFIQLCIYSCYFILLSIHNWKRFPFGFFFSSFLWQNHLTFDSQLIDFFHENGNSIVAQFIRPVSIPFEIWTDYGSIRFGKIFVDIFTGDTRSNYNGRFTFVMNGVQVTLVNSTPSCSSFV